MIHVKKMLPLLPFLAAVVFIPALVFAEGWGLTGSSADFNPPSITVHPVYRSFSPNNDGVMDYGEFRFSMKDSGRIKGWRFQILQGDRIVREFRHVPRNLTGGGKVFSFLRKLWRSDVVPDRLLWDGRNTGGMLMGNGEYHYSLTAWDGNDNISALKEGTVYIDTNAPRVHSVLAGYGAPGTVSIGVTVQSFKYDRAAAVIRDDGGSTVRMFQWRADAVPSVLVWDGKGADGKPVDEGTYSCSIEVRDSAGNADRTEVRNIVIERIQQPVRVDADCTLMSYRKRNGVNFTVSRGFTASSAPWTMIIENSGGTAVRTYSGRSVPFSVAWDGKDNAGKTLRDGMYFYKMVMVLGKENTYTSPPKEFRIDSTPPELRIRCGPEGFSPDGDRDDDFLTLRPSYSDFCAVKEWKITAVDENGSPFYQWNGKGALPERITWDGNGYGSAKVESVKPYRFRLYAEDEAGNTAVSGETSVTSGVLVRSSCEGFHIRLGTGFNEDTDRPDPAFLPVLHRLSDIVSRYQAYAIKLEVHTDVRGDDHDNLLVSEKRAKFVADLLRNRSEKEIDISFRGMGETIPLVKSGDEHAGRKNNRIEIKFLPRMRE